MEFEFLLSRLNLILGKYPYCEKWPILIKVVSLLYLSLRWVLYQNIYNAFGITLCSIWIFDFIPGGTQGKWPTGHTVLKGMFFEDYQVHCKGDYFNIGNGPVDWCIR